MQETAGWNRLCDQLFKNLEEKIAKRREQEEEVRCEITELRVKLCTIETLSEKNYLKAQNLKQELEKTKTFYLEIAEK